ncbi:MAG: GTP-binding protein [archaeon]|nr:GTP-binding protein [archaeon]
MTENEDDSLKVILLGESSVGKTCIINRFISNKYEKNLEGTLGASFSSKTIVLKNGTQSKLAVWDTAGSERFRTVNKFFYRDAVIAILVYDITNTDSFEEIRNYWAEEVKNNTENNISNKFIFNSL